MNKKSFWSKKKCSYCKKIYLGYCNSSFCSRKCYEKSKISIKECEICGSEFLGLRRARFCSNKCIGKNNANKRKGSRNVTCIVCKTVFKVKKSQLKRRNPKYCSKSCMNKSYKLKIQKKKCLYCNNDYLGSPATKYCSENCKINSSLKFNHICKCCRNKFYTRYKTSKYCGNKCCRSDQSRTSIEEQNIVNFISSIYSGAIIQSYHPLWLNGKELDIYIPELNLAIEYNGLYWHSEQTGKNRLYHINKTNLCLENKIKLIHIFEDEWINKPDIVKSKLKSLMNKLPNKIHARKCTLKELDPKSAKFFLDKNHLQGNVNASIKIGAFYNNKLVAIATFGKLRKSLGSKNINNVYELIRYCPKINYNIPGIFSKMVKFFIKKYNPIQLETFADIRWSPDCNKLLYPNLGFLYSHTSSPNYWYVDPKNGLVREHRFKYRKNVLVEQGYNSSMTEREIMDTRGFLRVWDCGNYKYVLKLN